MKYNRQKLSIRFAIAGIAMSAMTAQACVFDGQFGDPFMESFPGSLNVAMATRQAIDKQQILEIEALDGLKALRRVSWWLQVYAKENDRQVGKASYIYMVDSKLWSKVGESGQLEIHTAPTADEDVGMVLMMTETSLNALMSKKIEFDQGLEMGVIKLSPADKNSLKNLPKTTLANLKK